MFNAHPYSYVYTSTHIHTYIHALIPTHIYIYADTHSHHTGFNSVTHTHIYIGSKTLKSRIKMVEKKNEFHFHQIMLTERISLTLTLPPFQSSIVPGKSSKRHAVSLM